ncbi:unnamed protein product [Rotaria magnacalcarata]|uniref:U-box domain-containing protein n=1 Tax=Rotaria magnacalcarata TaxID=392030 RepID=A0A818Y139_9BILA|nr:unnamed protein product [Rotaria magnacalcarata]
MQEIVTTRAEDYDLVCPITLRAFRDPVIAVDGRTYEREAIVRWIAEHGTSPFTRQPLNIKDLQPNYHMRNMAGRRGSSASSYYAVDESRVYQYPPTAPVNDEGSIVKASNNHGSGEGCSLRRLLFILIIVIILIISIICGLTLGLYLRKPFSTNKLKYSSSFTANSPTYCRITCTNGQFYYNILTVSVTKAGKYKFTSESNIDTYGYIYNSSFNPANPRLNLLAEDNDSATAPGSYYNYSSSLTSSSPKYCRRDKKCRESLDFYYEALQISVSMNGNYHFVSSGSVAMYTDIYNKTFDKLKPNQNLVHPIDESSEENQFKLEVYLITGNKYIMVVTTKKGNIMGKFSVTAIGSGSVTFRSLH